ncbi:unnamed protein product [Bursaphelenchus xylophilus]|uniref:(pine wood nematode) hypothetical protein n=1 Tax=Bursaphelenchus xylophilus TaxID=6326 RepID=A0A1I7STZ8_BURXY|nr:unnamed protein product [Bursaphelenchus xylophilus]CAG9107755.1 unnamed protein product [Bursaphelenchus xylophilus]
MRLLFLLILVSAVHSRRSWGTWKVSDEKLKIITTFGVQPFNKIEPELTRGFLFGNATAKTDEKSDVALLVIPETRFHSFRHSDFWQFSCPALMENISGILFEPRCLRNGRRGDHMRWIPCPKGKYCIDEDKPSQVIKGSQFTFRIDEPYVPEYWHIILVACRLDENCSWVESERLEPIEYDITLTNGHPVYGNWLTNQFSFEEQNILEVIFLGFVCFGMLSIVQGRSQVKSKYHILHLRSRLLLWIINLEVLRLGIQLFNMSIYALHGSAFSILNYFAELIRNLSVCLLCLLLLLLSSGWSLRKTGVSIKGYYVFNVWLIFSFAHLLVFTYDYVFMEAGRNYFDFVDSKVLHVIVGLRLVQGIWFLVEMKRTLRIETSRDRSNFLVHFGAAYMVWFTYYILLVLVSMAVSEFWRIKFVISVTTFANFVALACLVHIFWPTSSYRKFFSSDLMVHRTLSNGSSGAENDEYDMLIAVAMNSDDEDTPHTPFH